MKEESNDISKPDFEGEAMKMPENTDATPLESTNKSIISGPILLSLTLLLVLIFGGIYYWFFIMNSTPDIPVTPEERPTPEENNEPESTTAEARTQVTNIMSSSNELSAIESDLDSTNIDDFISDINIIDNEIQANTEGI